MIYHNPYEQPLVASDNFELYRAVNQDDGQVQQSWNEALRVVTKSTDVDVTITPVSRFRVVSLPGDAVIEAVQGSFNGRDLIGEESKNTRAAQFALMQTIKTSALPYSYHAISRVPVLEPVAAIRGKESLSVAWLVDTTEQLLNKEALEAQRLLGSEHGIHLDNNSIPLVPFVTLATLSARDAHRNPTLVGDLIGVARDIRPSTVNVSSLHAFGQTLSH